MRKVGISIFFLGLASISFAGDFTVQLAALSKPNPEFETQAANHGEVRTSASPEGLIRYRIGHFDTLFDAEEFVIKLRNEGFTRAYVVALSETAVAIESSTELPELGSLPSDVRDQVVLLDGELHVKEGDNFIPVAQYLANNNR